MMRLLFSTIMLLTLSLPSIGQAKTQDPEIYFYPMKGWAIDQITNEHAGMLSQTCLLTAEFNNGFFMQISGSDQWVTALEIDFQQNIFEPGSIHDVTLNVPGINNKTLTGQSTSASNLSISLKDARGFYKDLRNSSVLDFKIDKNSFRFYMVGLTAKASNFETCLASSTVVAKTGHQATPEIIQKSVPKQTLETAPPQTKTTSSNFPALRFKRSGRKRLTETIAEEMERNPGIARIEPLREKRPTTPAEYVPFSGTIIRNVEEKQLIRPVVPHHNSKNMPLYKSGLSTPPAPNWDNYKEPKASAAPSNLLVPPGFDNRP